MKTLYLVRHAKSSWKFPDLADFDRPLNRRGQRDAPMMGQRLHQRGVLPDLIISSPARRTQQTARALAEETGYRSAIRYEDALYHASPEELLAVIHTARGEVSLLMLVGHNPGLTELLTQLTLRSIDNVVTAGVVTVQFTVDRWTEVTFGSGKFGQYDYPKLTP